MTDLAEILAGWPLVVSLAAAVTARGLHAGRRRGALNEALHELRRPLQSLALACDAGATEPRAVESSLRLASTALEQLDREINGDARPEANGGIPAGAREVLAVRPLLASAVGRWQGRASLAGGSLELRWREGEVLIEADRHGLAQALDNLIVNAIEHGGPSIVVSARLRGGRLRIAVADSGRASRPGARREGPAKLVAHLSGRRRRGHGLAVVRQNAALHGGRFALRRSERGSLAVLELPLPTAGSGQAA